VRNETVGKFKFLDFFGIGLIGMVHTSFQHKNYEDASLEICHRVAPLNLFKKYIKKIDMKK
jgi:hypothetical protein